MIQLLHAAVLILCIIATCAALALEHVILWNKPWRLSRVDSYRLGVLTLSVGYGVFMLTVQPGAMFALGAYAAIVFFGGATTQFCYYIRARSQARDRIAYMAGTIAGPQEQNADNGSDQPTEGNADGRGDPRAPESD